MKEYRINNRVIMFIICNSLEMDLKKFIIEKSNDVSIYKEDEIKKANFRKKIIDTDFIEILNQLDLGDFINIISRQPYNFKINNEKVKLLTQYFQKIIPIRNRVMHTKPLELGDKSFLLESLETIDSKIKWINWYELKKNRETIKNNPNELIKTELSSKKEYNQHILHNLPFPEFDDTGYIGRKNEKNEIKGLIENNKNQIITIVGNGGIGKTALTVKVLYELLEEQTLKFDAIIWFSLKTKTLSKSEFINLKNSIDKIQDIFLEGEKIIIKDNNLSPQENLIEFMNAFNTLLVLDNLETINSEEINHFLKLIPENSKILITSRHGLGELEYRYKLNGLSCQDAIEYFRELSMYLGLEEHKKNNSSIKKIVENYLYLNPLSIKWYLSSIRSGISSEELIANRNELIDFCMSNVYKKLSLNSQKILQLFLIENQDLVMGEIEYYTQIDEVNLRICINELLTTNMITLKLGKYVINEMAKDYLSIFHAPNNEFLIETYKNRKKLNGILQEIKIKNELDPFNPKSLFKNTITKNNKFASIYLMKALEHSAHREWKESYDCIEKAESISPNYFEIYKIKAFISSEKRDLYNAITNYEIALNKAEEDLEKASVLFLFSIFHSIRMNDSEAALELINRAELIIPNNVDILLEKTRVLMFLGKFEETENLLNEINENINLENNKNENIYLSRYAELYRRMAEQIKTRDLDLKINLLKKSIEKIEIISEIDLKSYLVLLNTFKDLSFLYYNEEVLNYLILKLEAHCSRMKGINHYNVKKMIENFEKHKNDIPEEIYNRFQKCFQDYKKCASEIKDANKGIIVYMEEGYGFISNSFEKKIYFNRNYKYKNLEIGDNVQFKLWTSERGKKATDIFKI